MQLEVNEGRFRVTRERGAAVFTKRRRGSVFCPALRTAAGQRAATGGAELPTGGAFVPALSAAHCSTLRESDRPLLYHPTSPGDHPAAEGRSRYLPPLSEQQRTAAVTNLSVGETAGDLSSQVLAPFASRRSSTECSVDVLQARAGRDTSGKNRLQWK